MERKSVQKLLALTSLALAAITFACAPAQADEIPPPSYRAQIERIQKTVAPLTLTLIRGNTVLSVEGEAAKFLYDAMKDVKAADSLLGKVKIGKQAGCLEIREEERAAPLRYRCEVALNAAGSFLTQSEIEGLYDPDLGDD